MSGIGVLEAVHPDERTRSVAVVRPGGVGATSLSKGKARGSSESEALGVVVASVVAEAVTRAEKRVERARTSTTLAALAQCYSMGDDAVRVAREALSLALMRIDDEVVDAPSARLAADVLVRNGMAEAAYEALDGAKSAVGLRLTLAAVAASVDRLDDAAQALEGVEGQQADAFRGYLASRAARWSESVRYFRAAIRGNPADVDSIHNLSVALWRLGSANKATKAALQATRMAPGRRDVSLHYLELLLQQDEVDRAASEIRALRAQGVLDNARLMVAQGRVELARGNESRGMSTLRKAAELAKQESDGVTRAEVVSNLAVMRLERGLNSREEAIRLLKRVVDEYPESDIAIIKYAQAALRPSESEPIRDALKRMSDLDPTYVAYLRCHLATLEGDATAAASSATEWFRLEPGNPGAAAAAIVAIGIGEERWADAALVADHAVQKFPDDRLVVNNAAYVLAMAGKAREAIRVVERFGTCGFVLKATLGLAYLADGDIESGTRLYREAADEAEKVDPVWRSLMTAYQAIVVRQLELSSTSPGLESMLLAPVPLPDDWQDRSDFIRLKGLFDRHAYPWPPTPDLPPLGPWAD